MRTSTRELLHAATARMIGKPDSARPNCKTASSERRASCGSHAIPCGDREDDRQATASSERRASDLRVLSCFSRVPIKESARDSLRGPASSSKGNRGNPQRSARLTLRQNVRILESSTAPNQCRPDLSSKGSVGRSRACSQQRWNAAKLAQAQPCESWSPALRQSNVRQAHGAQADCASRAGQRKPNWQDSKFRAARSARLTRRQNVRRLESSTAPMQV